MTIFHKTVAATATLALLMPGAALAGNGHGKPATSGKAGAPGQVCKSLKVKGKKTPEQRAAYKKCIQDAVAKRKADKAANAKADNEADNEADDEAPAGTPEA